MGREPEASGAPPHRVTYLEVSLGIAVQNRNCVMSVLLSGLAPKASYIVKEAMMPKGVELIVEIVVQNAEYVVRLWF